MSWNPSAFISAVFGSRVVYADESPAVKAQSKPAPTREVISTKEGGLKKALDFLWDYPVYSDFGKFDEISKETKEFLDVDTGDGFRFDYSKVAAYDANKTVMFSHRFWLGSQMLREGSNYEFSGQLAMREKFTMDFAFDSMQGFHCGLGWIWNDSAITRVRFNDHPFFPTPQDVQISHEQRVLDSWFTSSLSRSSREISFMSPILRHVGLGAALALQNQQNLLVTGLRYDDKQNFGWIIMNTSGPPAWNRGKNAAYEIGYGRRVSQHFGIATELKLMGETLESNFKVGARYSPNENSSLKVSVDQHGHLSSAYDQLVFGTLRIGFSGDLNHPKNEYRFGFSVMIG